MSHPYCCFRCDGQPTIYAIPEGQEPLAFIANHEDWHNERDRLRGACIAMSRFLVFVWMEAEARCSFETSQGRDPSWYPTYLFLQRDRERMLSRFALDGRLRLAWSDS